MKYSENLPSLYSELAEWWPVLSTPEDYAEEARFYQQVIKSASSKIPKTLLELGSGGGNNASHMKLHFEMTLVDLAPGMLEVSKRLNPESEHIQGDMRTVRLDRQFDSVFIQDAIMYMLTESDLFQAIETAFVHCQPGGVALFAPDSTRETFKESTGHGGHDRGERGLRYLDWTHDSDDTDSTYVSDMVYLLRDGAGQVRCVHDRHIMGLFGHDDWLRLIAQAGFQASSLPFEHSEIEPGSTHVFVGIKPEKLTNS
ncbi:class I SAM-dependent DNA methyltransferase [Chloroflexota bacterium]